MSTENEVPRSLQRGQCPDAACKTTLYFEETDSVVLCKKCGQQHAASSLLHITKLINAEFVNYYRTRNILLMVTFMFYYVIFSIL